MEFKMKYPKMRTTDNVYIIRYVIEGKSAEAGKNKLEAKERLLKQLNRMEQIVPSPYLWKVKMKEVV